MVVIEWPERARRKPKTKYWALDLASNITFWIWFDAASGAGAFERDYQELRRRSGSGRTMKDAGGVASIITPRCASQPTASGPERETIPPSGPRAAPARMPQKLP